MWNWKGCYLCDNSDKNPKMKIGNSLCPQKFYLSVNSNPVQIKIAVSKWPNLVAYVDGVVTTAVCNDRLNK